MPCSVADDRRIKSRNRMSRRGSPKNFAFRLNHRPRVPIAGKKFTILPAMIARHFRSSAVTVLLFAMAGAVIAATAWTMEVSASRGLRLVVVDGRRASVARDASHRAFAVGLAAAANQRSGAPLEIGVQCVNATEARLRFDNGACDAVLVLADDRPTALRRMEALTLCGELEPEIGSRPTYLIVSKEDAAVRDLLAGAFANLLANKSALQAIALAGEENRVKVADLTR